MIFFLGFLFAASAAAVPTNTTMVRHWHETILLVSHLASADPTVHARDFFHWSLVQWEVWRLFAKAPQRQSLIDIDVAQLPPTTADLSLDTELAQANFAFLTGKGWQRLTDWIVGNVTQAMNATGILPDSESLGARIGRAVQAFAVRDGDVACEAEQYECKSPQKRGYETANPERFVPLWDGVGGLRDPNRWQRLDIGTFIDKASQPVDGYPDFTTPQWGELTPFALRAADDARRDANGHWVWRDPGPPPLWGPDTSATHAEFIGNYTVVAKCGSMCEAEDRFEWQTSPGNHTLGANNAFQRTTGCDLEWHHAPCANVGAGHEFNPSTGAPYAPNSAKRGDYARIVAEFWSRQFWLNGPQSDSPIRHWNSMLDESVLDHADFAFRFGGGERLERQQYEIFAYLALNAAMFDSSIAAWSIKRHYDSVRPVTAIRFLATLGQSSDPARAGYHPGGIALLPQVTHVLLKEEVCTYLCEDFSVNVSLTAFAPGPLYWLGFDRIGTVVTRGWQAFGGAPDDTGIAWRGPGEWLPFRRPSFVTPPFAGYVSGHSTFARAAADTLARITGDHFWPGGLFRAVAKADEFYIFGGTFTGGIPRDVELQYATYSDAADECGLSRIYAGAHIPHDDVPARGIGRHVARRVWEKLTAAGLFGAPQGQRVAVQFVADVRETNTVELVQWARKQAQLAHQQATGDAGGDVQVQVIGRAPGEPERCRTVLIARTVPDTAERLQTLLRDRAESTVVLTCDDLDCIAAPSTKLASGAIVGIAVAVSGATVALIGAAAYWWTRKQRQVTIA
jgi:hypothetical protein